MSVEVYIGGEVDYSEIITFLYLFFRQLDNIVSSEVEYLGLIRSLRKLGNLH